MPWTATRGWHNPTRRQSIVLGGPIGAEEDDRYPFLAEEIDVIRRRIDSERPLLGICLGAQLMARAQGARVRPLAAKEIGYAPLTITEAGRHTPIASIEEQAVLHWHGDQFDLPAGVPSLAGTSICPHQAFMLGAHAMAWQFHLEVDARQIERWLIGHAVELAQACIPRLVDEIFYILTMHGLPCYGTGSIDRQRLNLDAPDNG